MINFLTKIREERLKYLIQRVQVIHSSFSVDHESMLIHFDVGGAPNQKIHKLNFQQII